MDSHAKHEDVISLVFNDSDTRIESLNMLAKLKPTYFYKYMKENPKDVKVLLLAKMLHEGQKDEAGMDYMVHLIHATDIALKIKGKFSLTKNLDIENRLLVKTVLLHDSLEDEEPMSNAKLFNRTIEDLFLEYNIEDSVVDSIKIMSRNREESYSEFIEKIRNSGDEYAIIGKVADLMSNMHPLRSGGKTKSLEKRYIKAINKLGADDLLKEKAEPSFNI